MSDNFDLGIRHTFASLPYSPTTLTPKLDTQPCLIDAQSYSIDTRPCFIDTLPNELLEQITAYLPFGDKLRSLSISRRWHARMQGYPAWRCFDFKLHPQHISQEREMILRHRFAVGTRCAAGGVVRHARIDCAIRLGAENLLTFFSNDTCRNLRTLNVHTSMAGCNIRAFLPSMTQLRALDLGPDPARDFSFARSDSDWLILPDSLKKIRLEYELPYSRLPMVVFDDEIVGPSIPWWDWNVKGRIERLDIRVREGSLAMSPAHFRGFRKSLASLRLDGLLLLPGGGAGWSGYSLESSYDLRDLDLTSFDYFPLRGWRSCIEDS